MFKNQGPPFSRAFSFVLLVVCMVLLIGTIIVAYYNAQYSWDLIQRIASGEGKVERAALQKENDIPGWVMPFIQDLSMVSPGLVAFTIACMLHASFLMFLPTTRKDCLDGRKLPFPTVYRGYYVQLGLLGTIIGFTLAFMNVQLQGERELEILLAALGTALWSTLIALFLAFVVCPPIEKLYQWVYQLRTGERYPSGLGTALADQLNRRMIVASQSLDEFSRSLNSFSSELDLKRISGRLAAIEETINSISNDSALIKADSQVLKDGIKEIQEQLTTLSEIAGTNKEQVEKLKDRAENFVEQIRNIVS